MLKDEMIPDKQLVDINGELMPVYLSGQPVLVELPDCRGLFVMIFDSEEKLREYMKFTIPELDYEIKIITESMKFCESVWENDIRIMRNPHVKGNDTHWIEIIKDEVET
jgi:hypothetical protein